MGQKVKVNAIRLKKSTLEHRQIQNMFVRKTDSTSPYVRILEVRRETGPSSQLARLCGSCISVVACLFFLKCFSTQMLPWCPLHCCSIENLNQLSNIMSDFRSKLRNTVGKGSFCLQRTGLYSCYIGEGDGNPLQYSCLENSMDGGAW